MLGISFGYFFSSDNFFPQVNCFVLEEFYVVFQKFYFGKQFNILFFILGSVLESIICALLKECLEKRIIMDTCHKVHATDHAGVHGEPALVPGPEQQQSPLQTHDGRLPDDLVKTLRVQLPPHLGRYWVDMV